MTAADGVLVSEETMRHRLFAGALLGRCGLVSGVLLFVLEKAICKTRP